MDAIENGKIKAESKDYWIAFGKSDHVSMTGALEAINFTATATLKDVIDNGAGETAEMTKEMFWANYKSGKYVNNIELYKEDYKKAYGKEPKI